MLTLYHRLTAGAPGKTTLEPERPGPMIISTKWRIFPARVLAASGGECHALNGITFVPANFAGGKSTILDYYISRLKAMELYTHTENLFARG